MMHDSGVYQVPAGVERVTIPHQLGIAPNIVEVQGAPEGSEVFTLANTALLIILPAPLGDDTELAWMVGYEEPAEPIEEVPAEQMTIAAPVARVKKKKTKEA